jgi:hypothetical protein
MRVGPFVMFTNAMTAFGLNVAAVFLIGAAGGLVLTLAGVFKVSSGGLRSVARDVSRRASQKAT